MQAPSIHFFAIITAAGLNMILGALWYSPLLFAKPWLRAVDLQGGEPLDKEFANQGYLASAVASFVSAFSLGILVQLLHVAGVWNVLSLGLTVGLGLFATLSLPHYLFAGKTVNFYLINMGYTITSLVAMSLVIGLWR